MNTLTIFFVAATAIAVAVNGEEKVLNDGNNVFTANMFSEVAKEQAGKSVVMSAFSVLQPLAQLALASIGESHDQILKAIGLSNDNVIKEVFPKLNAQLDAVKEVELKMANKLYIPKDAEVKKDFAALSKTVFDSEFKNIDFAQPALAAKEINTWVEEHTNNTIKNLVDPKFLGRNTRLVLVNALYFKSSWLNRFPGYNTNKQDFYVTKDKTVQLPTMKQTNNFNYAESKELGAKLLELPYKGNEASLLIVLPNEIDGLRALQDKLKDPTALDKAVAQLQKKEVKVLLPKVKIETTINLKNVLQQIGVTSLFNPNARLDNLLKNDNGLFVSDAIQKVAIDVYEEGTEAAAANVFYGVGAAAPRPGPQPTEFKADHPFVFVLKLGNLKLFSGIFAN